MFTGIIEALGKVENIEKEGSNMLLTVSSPISHLFKIDQSVSHNGACLTVIEVKENTHKVCLIDETLKKTNFNDITEGSIINMERAMQMGDRLDGHMVQGHVDCTGVCTSVEDAGGSTVFTFTYSDPHQNITVEKGSITVSGVSLTVVNSQPNKFSVAIIPYTYEHTIFKFLKVGSTVNLEFDMMGKYFKKWAEAYFSTLKNPGSL